jgi:chromosome segregation ATPase
MISRKRARKPLIAALLGFALTSVSARAVAASDTFKQSAELGQRTAKTSKDIDKYVAQLGKTEAALSSVSGAQGKDLKKRYESFSKEVKNLEEAQKHATSDINEMQSNGAKYFSSWDESIAQIFKSGTEKGQCRAAVKSHERPR